MRAVPAFRYHGGKFRLASWVIQHFPPHLVYVEPYGGAAGVLLQKPRSYAEVYNDLDGEVVNYFRVIRDPVKREQLIEACALTPYARAEFEDAFQVRGNPDALDTVERARLLAVRAQMGFGSAGATKATTGFRIDTRRKYGTAQQLWARFSDNILFAAARFSEVLVEQRPAIEVMRQHDGVDTLHFVDPPYVHSTRQMGEGKSRGYQHEMTDDDHVELLEVLKGLAGMVVVCGYRHDIYDDLGWRMETTQSRISAGRGTALREECIWINPAADRALKRSGFGLFTEGHDNGND